MEIACSIPPYPAAVPLEDLVDDFGCLYQDRVLAHLNDRFGPGRAEIMPMTYRDRGRWISVAAAMWPEIRFMCQEYWADMAPFYG
jgi:hypothetical protein